MGLRELFRRSAKALVGEVVERVDRAFDPRRERQGSPERGEPAVRAPSAPADVSPPEDDPLQPDAVPAGQQPPAHAPPSHELHGEPSVEHEPVEHEPVELVTAPPELSAPESDPAQTDAVQVAQERCEPHAHEPAEHQPAPLDHEPHPDEALAHEPAGHQPAPRDPASDPAKTASDVHQELARAAASAPLPAAPESRDVPDQEPILTRTMAGVLAAQGFHERALRIYDHLLAEHPTDADLADEASAVRTRTEEGNGAPVDEVAAVSVRRDALLVSWKVTDRSIERARTVLGADGTLTARVVVVARAATDVRSDVREHAPIDGAGEHVFTSVPRGSRCTASVGLRSDDRFVSVAHSRVVPT